MLQTITHVKGFLVHAPDGYLGTVDQLFFDDLTWTVRYLTVETGRWLAGRRVLLSPFSIARIDWQARRVDVSLTRNQVENAPDINTKEPVSRQHEAACLSAFGYPNYWSGPSLWGPIDHPFAFAASEIDPAADRADKAKRESKESHLRSTRGVRGYDIQAIDGEIGLVCGFLLDDETWSIRYVEVATRNWWPGHELLLSPAWIHRVGWISSKIYVALSRRAIETGPEHRSSLSVTREYEDRLYLHYGRLPYWRNAIEPAPSLSLTTV